jgi:hypothetical protein
MPLKINNVKYPRCTEIISDTTSKFGLDQWKVNLAVDYILEEVEPGYEAGYDEARYHHKAVSQEAMAIGSEVHDMIADYLESTPKDQEEPIGKEITNAYTAFKKFLDDYEMETIEFEKRMVFPDWCGQLDWVGVLSGPKVKHPGELYVLDWKCSKRLYRETRVQTAAYRWGCGVEADLPIAGNGAVRLCKETGEYEFKDYSDTYDDDKREFFLCKELYLLRHPVIRKGLKKATEDKNE